MILAALALVVSAPSFDCTKASTTVEKMICTDSELAGLDRAVARLYAGIPRSAKSDRLQLWTSQADWLKERDACSDKDCLVGSYDSRLFDLFMAATRAPTREYQSKDANGTLSILDLGGGWYAFYVQALWIGSNPGAANTDQQSGHFKLTNGKAEKVPDSDGCGWQIERLSRDRWKFTEMYPDDETRAVGCGGLSARATGVYSR
jgi:uncharacterized protein